jgi:hypothetical protein
MSDTPSAREALSRLIELDEQAPTGFEIGTDPQWTSAWYQAIHQARQALAPKIVMNQAASAASIPMESLDAQSLAVQLEEDGKYLLASAMANECPKTRDLAVRVIRAAVLLAGGWEGER